MSQTIVFANAWLQDQSLTWPARCLLGLLYKLTDGGKHPFYSKNANSYISRIMCFTANELRTSWKSLVKSQYIVKNISQQAGNATEVTLLPKAYEDETLRNPHEGLLNSPWKSLVKSQYIVKNISQQAGNATEVTLLPKAYEDETLRNPHEGLLNSHEGLLNSREGLRNPLEGTVKSTRGIANFTRGTVNFTRGSSENHARGRDC